MNQHRFDPGPPADVDCVAEDDGDRWTLVFVRDLGHSAEKVWAALTDPAQLGRWAPFTADRELGRVGEATLTMTDGDEAQDLPATVSVAERPRRLEYSWGGDRLSWELAPTETGTRLILRHTVGERELLPKVAAGWHLCLVVAAHLLDGDPIERIVGEEAKNYGWDELHDEYARKLLQ